MVVPQGPGSHASPPFDGQLWQSLPRSQDLASLAVYICSQAWLSLLPWEERSVPMLCASRPAADWLQRPGGSTSAGWPANDQVSLVAKCVFMPDPLQKASFVAVAPPPPSTVQLLSSETALSESSSGGCRQLPVLGASPGSLPRLLAGEELPPAMNRSRGGCSCGARVSSQDQCL